MTLRLRNLPNAIDVSAEYDKKRGNILKTRIISAAVGLVLLGVVIYFFNTPVLDVAVALLSAIVVH